ncbi:receptor-type guanylate cyclase gcy-5-like isoform X2 [Amphibalanus amphitrite]|nr:receptor-type guanylate cyclase gcy-5-like isoform X2 [Amphibalanus amphitrite]
MSDCPRENLACQDQTCDSKTFSPPCHIPSALINLQAWTPASYDLDFWAHYNVLYAGRLGPETRIGWFLQERVSNSSRSIVDHWRAFQHPETARVFNYTDAEVQRLRRHLWDGHRYNCEDARCVDGVFVPDACRGNHCAVLLASTSNESGYVIELILKYHLQVRVFWVGDNLGDIVRQRTDNNEPVLFAHHAPSPLTLHSSYVEVAFPPCLGGSTCPTGARYLKKLAWSGLKEAAGLAYKALADFRLSQSQFEELMALSTPSFNPGRVACDWMRRNNITLMEQWLSRIRPTNMIYLGGIFPIMGSSYQDPGVIPAVMMAIDAINRNTSLLSEYKMDLLISDGQCSADMVMKTFINYLRMPIFPQMAGVLGPACSNTLEPIVGVARHFKVVVISFSAEGVLLTNRTQYPYFFRTIGENKQFRFVYKQLLKQLQFKRVASLTEAGQKYSEYISLLHDMLQESGVTFVSNRKFPSDTINMTPYLKDLREQNARIIIADMYQVAARAIMCEAYHQNMTAKEGYLWFLPEWFSGGWFNTPAFSGNNKRCSIDQIMQALDGHLALAHADYASNESIMQENITVSRWKELYEVQCSKLNVTKSKYASYAYDATWTYALALDKLLREQSSRYQDLHRDNTTIRLVELLNVTDFHGVSGHLRFVGPSRVSVTEVKQWRRDGDSTGYHVVGRFYPDHSIPEGGRLEMDESKIRWLTPNGLRPVDGSSPPCDLQPLADLLDISCQDAMIVANVVGLLPVILLFLICALFYKRRYERKMLRLQEMGLGNWVAYSPEWELKRENIVTNRKLGEGAFGTVYGGEALLVKDRERGEAGGKPDKKRVQNAEQPEEWCSVAVKTLKLNATLEEKQDFLREADIMKGFDHTNIVRLLGVCTLAEPLLTVMEFMLHGDLKTFLLSRRNPKDECGEISDKNLTSMARDVACALSYLADRKFVHRDVACRNCLVSGSYVVKLADFGMTRSLSENNYYKFHREAMLPVRWMAPESLAEGIFTPMSDIWSYGVLLFEITTCGSFPFQGYENGQVLDIVRSGRHITIPPGVKPEFAELLEACWSFDPDDRPEARRLVEVLGVQHPRLISRCLDEPLSVVQLNGAESLLADGRRCGRPATSRPRPPAQRAQSHEHSEPAEARHLLERSVTPVTPVTPPVTPPDTPVLRSGINGYATKYVVLDHRPAGDNGPLQVTTL